MRAFLLIVCCIALVVGCERQNFGPKAEGLELASPAEIAAAPAPEGVDAALWRELTAELAHVVAAQPVRQVATAAAGHGSMVCDMYVVTNGIEEDCRWSYRCMGDYDLNGEVNISDLTSVAVHWKASSLGPNWKLHQFADGDGNGEVNISDVTPIGANLHARVHSYDLQELGPGDTDYVTVYPDIDFGGGSPQSGEYPKFQVQYDAENGHWYRVVPNDGLGNQGEPGMPFFYFAGPKGDWRQSGNDPFHRGATIATGPESVGSVWKLPIPITPFAVFSPVADANEVVYAATLEPPPGSDGDPTLYKGRILAVAPDGQLLWSYNAPYGFLMQPVILNDGTIVAINVHNTVYAFYPDGRLKWAQQLVLSSSMSFPVAPLADFEDNIYVIDGTPALRKLSPDGAILWTVTLPAEPSRAAPVVAGTRVVVATQDNMVHQYEQSDGSWAQSDALDDAPGWGMMVNPGKWGYVHLSGNNVGVQGFAMMPGVPFTYVTAEASITPPVLLSDDGIVYGVIDYVGAGIPPTGRLVNLAMDGTPGWDRPLGAAPYCTLAVDNLDRVYYGTTGAPAESGMHCLDPVTHDDLWFYPTGGYASGACIAGDSYVVFFGSDSMSEDAHFFLIGIHGMI